MFAVLKKEFKSYLLTPLGYIFIGIFLVMFSIFFVLSIGDLVNFENLFGNGATILTFIAPVLTMRMFAEERKTGTEQLILTSPRSITSIVLGKFIAAIFILAITEIFTLGYFVILKHYGDPSIKVAISTLIGFLLLGAAYISFGMFASSITESQIIAFIVPVGVFIAMWFLPYVFPVLSPDVFSEPEVFVWPAFVFPLLSEVFPVELLSDVFPVDVFSEVLPDGW